MQFIYKRPLNANIKPAFTYILLLSMLQKLYYLPLKCRVKGKDFYKAVCRVEYIIIQKEFIPLWRILSSKKNSSPCRACNMSLSLSRSGLGLSVHLSIIWFSSVLNKFFIMVVFSFIKASLGPIPFQSI